MRRHRFSFVTSLHHLKVDRPLGANWTIAGDLKISTSSSVAKSLTTPSLRQNIGELEARRILSGAPFLYATPESPGDDVSENRQLSILFTHLVYAQLFVNMLWLVKDNSINFELGFLQYPFVAGPVETRVSSNFLSALFTNATGDRGDTMFKAEELNKAIALYCRLYGQQHDEGYENLLVPMSSPSPMGQANRLTRAFYFVQAARATWQPAEKVAYYCTSFEALVSTSTSELAHQVAERVATLIGGAPREAVEIYRDLKRAYDTRSKLVHGGQLNAQEDRYLTDSTNCDNYLRRLFHILIANNDLRRAIEGKQDEVNRFFLDRIFGGVVPPTVIARAD